MINKWILEHFKSVNSRITLKLAPLTVFAGANSSGKSTIIQSILLTTQTIQSQVHSRPVVLNGHIVRLGTFNDVISNQAELNNIAIGFELSPNVEVGAPLVAQRRYYGRYFPRGFLEAMSSISCVYSFSATSSQGEKEILQLQPRLETCELLARGVIEKKDFEERIAIERTKREVSQRIEELKMDMAQIARTDISGLEYEVTSRPATPRRLRRYVGMPRSGDVVGVNLQHFLPSRYVIVYDTIEEQTSRILDFLLSAERFEYNEIAPTDLPAFPAIFVSSVLALFEETLTTVPNQEALGRRVQNARNLLENLKQDFSINTLMKLSLSLPPQIRREFTRKVDEKTAELRKLLRDGRKSEYNLAYIPLPEFLDGAADFVHGFFANQLKYLGPLRDEPKPVYPLAGSVDPRDIGFKGENTAAVLEVHRSIRIQYVPCKAFSELAGTYRPTQTTLEEAVLDWLEYLGVAHGIKTLDMGKLGHELKVSTAGSDSLHDLTHVGVGVSQVLPILVLSLLSEPGATLIFEQPELHLHPRVQTRLADFFVSMTMIEKQCIIETHSEYLINRLRYVSAVTDGDRIADKVILYFVEKDEGHSEYRPIRINKYGVIENWPAGFFDENEVNAAQTLKAGIQKRQKERDPK